MRSLTASLLLLPLLWGAVGCASADHAVSAAEPAPARFDRRLSLYGYPFPVQVHAARSQGYDLELAYMDVKPEGEARGTVLLLHGKNFSGAYWERTARDLLAAGYRVVMPDQIGFGKSSKPAPYQYSLAQMVDQTVGLLDALGVKTATVVGHSMGGMVATRFVLDHPERADALVLVSPIGLEDWSRVVPYASVDALTEAALKKTSEGVRAYMRESYFDGRWEEAWDAIAAIQMGWADGPDQAWLARVDALTADMIFTQPVVNDFPRVSVPTLLVIGVRDRTALGKGRVSPEVRATLGRYDLLGKAARDAIPGATLVELEGIGHLPQVEAYDRYWEALATFLGRGAAPATP
ncbi:MAG: alpha/beta hydrolase [Deltaproteobacteria bacterium]|nr:MAG: alpha/beta hydrolase [Deltaproteobacteria bacterium]